MSDPLGFTYSQHFLCVWLSHNVRYVFVTHSVRKESCLEIAFNGYGLIGYGVLFDVVAVFHRSPLVEFSA